MMKLALLTLLVATSNAFVVRLKTTPPATSTTRLNLEDWVAEMIDSEFHRQTHRKEFEHEWMEKNRGALLYHVNSDNPMMSAYPEDDSTFRTHAKDKHLAANDPERYCMDRCLATGNCDIFEEYLDLSAKEVMDFCNDCVLSEGEEPCDIPDGYYDKLMP